MNCTTCDSAFVKLSFEVEALLCEQTTLYELDFTGTYPKNIKTTPGFNSIQRHGLGNSIITCRTQ